MGWSIPSNINRQHTNTFPSFFQPPPWTLCIHNILKPCEGSPTTDLNFQNFTYLFSRDSSSAPFSVSFPIISSPVTSPFFLPLLYPSFLPSICFLFSYLLPPYLSLPHLNLSLYLNILSLFVSIFASTYPSSKHLSLHQFFFAFPSLYLYICMYVLLSTFHLY